MGALFSQKLFAAKYAALLNIKYASVLLKIV